VRKGQTRLGYDKHATVYPGAVVLAASPIWLAALRDMS
jgi:hypothetical protein